MASIAILIANAHYTRQDDLECCLEDSAAVGALVEAIGRHSDVRAVSDVDADRMREVIRTALSSGEPCEEIFFYFSGHGAQIGAEFFYCGTEFDAARPNETGLSHTELQDMLRAAEPELLVKVLDACSSGTLLVKSERPPPPIRKEGFRNVVQLASCRNDQNSFGGDPLSAFTRSFCEACLRKTEGAIYYGDIINTLRDDFLDNDEQTPFFVSQGTARELLVDDAAKLLSFRAKFASRWTVVDGNDHIDCERGEARELVSPRAMTPQQLLMAAEDRMAGPDETKAFIDALFDGVLARFAASEFAQFFDLLTIEHSAFVESTARDLIIRVLARESRPDNFVTVRERTTRKPSAWESALSSTLMTLDPEWTERWDLELNCRLERAQLRLTLTPKYRTLQRLVLVLTCAPSLERCYVFEVVTQHARTDWEGFDARGHEIVRRWYKMDWDEDLSKLVEKICVALEDTVRTHVETTTVRLHKD